MFGALVSPERTSKETTRASSPSLLAAINRTSTLVDAAPLPTFRMPEGIKVTPAGNPTDPKETPVPETAVMRLVLPPWLSRMDPPRLNWGAGASLTTANP